jgi:RNA polymerase sigma-70 factor (ECF subfamily)
MDRVSFEESALQQLDALYEFALRLTRDWQQAEDLVQDTYARAFASRASIVKGAELRPYMFRILRNRHIDLWRAQRRSQQEVPLEPDLEPICPLGTPLDTILSSVLSEQVEAALQSLQPPWRETLWLREVEDFSYEEISLITEVPIGTVRSRLSRARRMLFQQLEAYARASGLLAAEGVQPI